MTQPPPTPPQESIDALVDELRHPKYGQYDIYFSNLLKSDQLERIADADEHEVRAVNAGQKVGRRRSRCPPPAHATAGSSCARCKSSSRTCWPSTRTYSRST